MTQRTVTIPDHPRRPSRLYVALALVIAAAIFSVAAPTLRIEVEVGNELFNVPLGTRVGDLLAEGLLSPHAGDLVAVDGELLERGGGSGPQVFHNGGRIDESVRLENGDRLSARNGSDVIEGIEADYSPIPITVEHTGKGPLISLASPGVIGVRERVGGAISGTEVSSRVVTPMQPMVLKRYVPPPGSKVVALTLDDGPWPGHTETILDILKENDVKATFFMVGYLAERYPDVAKRVVEEGHNVANHTYSHKILTKHDGETVRREIVEGSRALHEVTGVMPRWFRPPGGSFGQKVVSEVHRVNLELVMWDVDPQDWKKPGVDPMLDELLMRIGPGSVILLHDGGGDRTQTVELLPRLITELKARGYVFLTMDELVP